MKYLITESQYKVLLKEQIQLPQIVKGSFSSTDGDDAHNFIELEKKLDQLLPQLYNQGINPKITSVTASIKKNGNQFDTKYSVTVDKSNDGKAWMGFTARGSFGHDYQQRADGQIDGSENEDKKSLKQKLESIGAIDIEEIKGSPVEDNSVPFKEYFFQFTKVKYPPLKANNSLKTSKTNPTYINQNTDTLKKNTGGFVTPKTKFEP